MRTVHVSPQSNRVGCDGCHGYPQVPAALIVYKTGGNHLNFCLDCAAFVRMALGHQIDKAVAGLPEGDGDQ
jgi:hypothetical protein